MSEIPDYAVMWWDDDLELWEVYGYRSNLEEIKALKERAKGKGTPNTVIVKIDRVTPDE